MTLNKTVGSHANGCRRAEGGENQWWAWEEVQEMILCQNLRTIQKMYFFPRHFLCACLVLQNYQFKMTSIMKEQQSKPHIYYPHFDDQSNDQRSNLHVILAPL